MDHVQLAIDFARNACNGSGARLTLLQATDHVIRTYGLGSDETFRPRVQDRWDDIVYRGFVNHQYADIDDQRIETEVRTWSDYDLSEENSEYPPQSFRAMLAGREIARRLDAGSWTLGAVV